MLTWPRRGSRRKNIFWLDLKLESSRCCRRRRLVELMNLSLTNFGIEAVRVAVDFVASTSFDGFGTC